MTLTHAFWVGRTEVTLEEWAADMTDRFRWRADDPADGNSCSLGDCPAAASWYHAARYANWLSEQEGLEGCYTCGRERCAGTVDPYSCEGYRMPTEAEWEYAARAGTDTRYSGGDIAVDVAWIKDNSEDRAHPVCTTGLAENAFGLCDMSGNLAEWANDSWDVTSDYPAGPAVDPGGMQGSRKWNRIVRGGGSGSSQSSATVSIRNAAPPFVDNGFRLVRSVVP